MGRPRIKTDEQILFEKVLYDLLQKHANIIIEDGFYNNVKKCAHILRANPDIVKELIERLNTQEEAPFYKTEHFLEKLLDSVFRHDTVISYNADTAELRERPEYIQEQIIYMPTKYSQIQGTINTLRPKDNQTFYDLGCGYGRVMLYTALMTDMRCKGIEILKDRISLPIDVAKEMDLENTEFITGNVLEQDLSDGDIFFMYNPFSDRTLQLLLEKLSAIAENKKIQIVYWAGRLEFLTRQNWLLHTQTRRTPRRIEIFESI